MVSLPGGKIILFALLCSALFAQAALTAGSSEPIRVAALYCDHAVNPPAIDNRTPVLGWILKSDRRGARQAAYRILVSRSPETVRHGTGDLWDSGKMNSDNSA